MKFLFSTALTLAMTGWGVPAQEVHRMPLDENTGSMVEIVSVFNVAPPTGYAPVRVRVTNNTPGERSITLRGTSRAENNFGPDHQLESSFTLTAPANKTTERDFAVPLCASMGRKAFGGSGSLHLSITAGNRVESFQLAAGGFEALPFTAFSKSLAAKSIADLNNAVSSRSTYAYAQSAFAALYDAADLPSDWRGYSGLDVLALTADEWLALAPGVRTAVLQWVKLGGVLNVYSKDGGPSLAALGLGISAEAGNVPARGGTAYALGHGHGRVATIPWDGSELEASHARDYAGADGAAVRRIELSEALREERSTRNPSGNLLVDALGEKNFAAWQVGIILFIFGIVVGPVNLFYFARAGRRHRLFYTTPLISVAAAVLLLIVIFFQDGTGGNGHRASAVYLDAAENTAFIRQFQVSRTGVLFGGSFSTGQPVVVNMALLPNTRWTRLKPNMGGRFSDSSRGEAQRYTAGNDSYAGDWFQSRSEQAQVIDAVLSTRGRIELKSGAGSPPVITSTFTASLDRLFYQDREGNYWVSPGTVSTGAEVVLTKSSREDFLGWRLEAAAMLPGNLRFHLAANDAKGFFYAASTDARAGIVATLESIDWQSDSVFLYGPLATP